MRDEELIQSLRRWSSREHERGQRVSAHTLQQAAETLERVTAERDRLRDALHAGYMLSRGRACFREYGGMPIEIGNAKRERLIRKALQEAIDE